MEYKCHLELNDFQQYMKLAFGAGYTVNHVKNMHGGAQKVVYKVECTNLFVCMLYVWDLSMNFSTLYFRFRACLDWNPI